MFCDGKYVKLNQGIPDIKQNASLDRIHLKTAPIQVEGKSVTCDVKING